MIFGNPVRGTIHPLNWHRPSGNHEPKLTQGFKGPAHDGIDISCAGKSVALVAMESGIVVFAGVQSANDRSINVVIDHGPLRTLIGHFREENVRVGQRVARGEPLGFMGATGLATAVHAHVEVFRESNSVRLDPWLFLAQNQPKTVRLRLFDGTRIRTEPSTGAEVYAETRLSDNTVRRVRDNENLGRIPEERPYGGTVQGGDWQLPDGTTGDDWYRIKFGDRFRFVARALAERSA